MAGGRKTIRWQLHESTQRALCRLTFLCVGLGPLVGCALLCLLHGLPVYQRYQADRWEEWLSAQMGVTVQLQACELLHPQKFALRQVDLLHPESGEAFGRIERAVIESHQGQWQVRLEQPEFEPAQLQEAWNKLHAGFLCRPQPRGRPVQLQSDGLTLAGLGEPQALHDFSARVFPDADALRVAVAFRWGTSKSPETPPDASPPTQVLIKRNHRAGSLMTEVQLRSPTPLPCATLATIVPHWDRLGRETTFTGVADLQVTGQHWSLQLTDAEFGQLDFGQLTASTQAAMSGSGALYVNRAVVNRQQLEYVEGSVLLGPGRIHSGFLRSVAQQLDVDLREASPVQVLAFEAAAFSFRVQPERLQLAGRLAEDALLRDSIGGVAVRSRHKWDQWLPLANVIDLLDASRSESALPTRSRLARAAALWLPIESQVKRTASNLRLSQSH